MQRQVSFTVAQLAPWLLALCMVDDLFLDGGHRHRDRAHPGRAPMVLASRVAQLDLAGPLAALRGLRELPDKLTLYVPASLTGQRRYNRYAVEDTAGAVLLGRALGARDHLVLPTWCRRVAPGWHGTDRPGRSCRVPRARGVVGRAVAAAPPWLEACTGPGTPHPPVAAALARLALYRGPGGLVADPFLW